jgi:hypothetical protein
MNATNNVTTATTSTTIANYTPINNHALLGMSVLVQYGNSSDHSYNPAVVGVVVAAYSQRHTISPTFLVMIPSLGDEGTFALCGHNTTKGESPFYTTNARRVGEGWGKVPSMARAIRAFGLDE